MPLWVLFRFIRDTLFHVDPDQLGDTADPVGTLAAAYLAIFLDGTWNSSFAEHKRYDTVSTADGEEHTVAELGNEWKAEHSHRARAARALLAALASLLAESPVFVDREKRSP